MTNFDLWVKACKEFRVEIWELDALHGLRFYKTVKYGEPSAFTRWNYPILSVSYHIWDGDKQTVKVDFRSALSIWRRWTRRAA